MGGCHPIGPHVQRPPYFSQTSALSLVDAFASRRAFVVGVSGEFSGRRVIGRALVLTSRPCQLIGVRSRFEARSWTEERDRGGSPEEQRAARGGTGQQDTQTGAFFPFLFFKCVDASSGRSAHGDSVLRGKLRASRFVETSGTVRKIDWELRCGWGFLWGFWTEKMFQSLQFLPISGQSLPRLLYPPVALKTLGDIT